jgi:hypothetical protein
MESYADALSRIAREIGVPFAPGSDAERAALDRFRALFSRFAPDRIERLVEDTYAADVWFDDTLKTIRGRDELHRYLHESASAVEDCRVEVDDACTNGGGDYYLRWRMTIRFRRFARGRDTRSIGMSHLRFDRAGRVALQQDYWNAAAGLYQHVPLLGAGIRAIQRRL